MAQSAGRQRAGKSGPVMKASGPESESRRESVNGVVQSMTDLDFLRGLIEAVDQSGIDSLEINRAGTRIRISKTPAQTAGPPAGYPALSVVGPGPAAATHAGGLASPPAATAETTPAAAAGIESGGVVAPAVASNLVDVKSPMVGTFYRAPAPDAPPYVEPGTPVARGQTLCILEAMKLMNELECEVDGVVREVLVEDADPVEFGQVLFRIESAASK